MTEKKTFNQDGNDGFGDHNPKSLDVSKKGILASYSYGGFSKLNPKKKTK